MYGIEGADGNFSPRPRNIREPSSLYELNRMFRLSSHQTEAILRPLSSGHAGVVVSLDTVLVDLTTVFGYSLAILAGDLDQETPTPTQVRDLVGGTFRDFVMSLGWDVPDSQLGKYEARLWTILDTVLKHFPLEASPGAMDLISQLISEGNEITVFTSLPRDLAIKLIVKTQLSALFEGRVPPERLLCSEVLKDTEETGFNRDKYGERYIRRRFLKCCWLMQKNPLLVVLLDGNRRHILEGKRTGLCCLALSGFSANAQFLRAADRVVSSLESMQPKDIYKMTRRAVLQEEGPEQQAAAEGVRDVIRLRQTAAPAEDNWKQKRQDTFADELGSDMQ
eukprot:CAMPEP_0173369922 /NCGR_PEP_ID=MMETSP1144-20121109/26372_1 /TAXON_ID=483371 /ORGANISM="non described non described, Strain CCMP2298" /LENGTH=335 /DNA_ID=CAMNT_0014321361 /DNA_START=400 /DNA_END=1407 /DNA_ORIENTATION=+